jgi:hypothetical protein
MSLSESEASLAAAAAKAGMSEKTARKYRRLGRPPSQLTSPRTYRTRVDAFADVWPEVEALLVSDESLQALTIFDHLCRCYPDRYRPSHLRTLQRQIKRWRATCGSAVEVFFPQRHEPGRQSQSDFTFMNELKVTIGGLPFDHLFYHFVLTYSNWEWGSICFSESFEALAEGLQTALWQLGGVPEQHRTDSLSAAVTLLGDLDQFTERYRELVDHYGMQASHTNVGRGNENGDVEQSHNRFKTAVDQELRLRSSRDFATRDDYAAFLAAMLERRNRIRGERLLEERTVLGALPVTRLDSRSKETPRVTRNATVHIKKNIYSVPSQLIGERVEARISGQTIEIWYGGQMVACMERLRGQGRHRIDYRHVIASLVRKPGAMRNYCYQEGLFPRLIYRVAYDWLCEHVPASAERQYVRLLELAATVSEDVVAEILREGLESGSGIEVEIVEREIEDWGLGRTPARPTITIEPVVLERYDALLALEFEPAGGVL